MPAGDVPLAGEIHQLLVSNQLPRGAEIDLLKLARRLDEKLSVIETALRHLARRRVVSISTSHEGTRYRVAAVSRQEAREIMLVRSLVEHCLVLELGKLRRRNAIIAAMGSALDEMRQALEQDDSQSFINHDIEFHVALAQGRTYMGGLLTSLTDVIHTAVPSLRNRAAFQRRIVGEHEAILKLITKGEYVEAAEEVRRHILNAGDHMF